MILSIQESVMRKSKHSEHAIIKSIKQSESGIPVKDICRELGISTALFYQWRSKYSGMEASDLKRLKDLGRGEPTPEADVRRPEHRQLP